MAKAGEPSSEKFNASMRIIALHGPERFLIEECTRQIALMLEKHFDGLEQFSFDGGVVEPAVLLDELRSYGLMQKHKLVILDNAEQFLAGGRGVSEDEDDDDDESSGSDSKTDGEEKSSRRPLMERYAASPVENATLVMRAATWRKGNLDKLITKAGTLIACEEQPSDRAANWCVSRCQKRYDAAIDLDAARLMVYRLGPSLQRLDTELQKLASMAGSRGKITRQLVEDNIAPTREEKAWVIQSVVASGTAGDMLGKLHDLTALSPRTEWVPISWAVIDLLRKEHAASHLLRRGVNGQSVARQLRLWGDSIGPVLEAAGRTEPHRLAQLLREAVHADHHSKSGLGEPVRNLETLMVKIADVTGSNRQ